MARPVLLAFVLCADEAFELSWGTLNTHETMSSLTLRSVQIAPKGSYREEHVLKFLSRWLGEWTEERARANDWRMVYLDAFSAHLTDRVRELAHECGFVLVYHGGGTTGVCQVNDTDLHAAFEREYVAAEMESFFEQNLADPGNIGRTRQQVIDDVVAVWRGLDHAQGVHGHKRTGLSVSLDGSEDHLINREARVFWDELAFGQVRDDEVARVRDAVARGDLSWCQADIDDLREPFPDGVGAFDEGLEMDCALEEEECPWSDHEPDSSSSDGRMDSDCEDSGTRASMALVPVDLPVVASDTPEEVAEAAKIAERLQTLEKIDDAARSSKLPAVQFHVQRQMRGLTKLSCSKQDGARPSALMRRFVRQRREEEDKRLRALRAENRAKALERKKVKDAARKLRVTKEAARSAAKARLEALAKLPKEFDTKMLGQGHESGGTRAHCANREALLERLRLRSPPLSRELEAGWDDFKKAYAKGMGAKFKASVGVRMLEAVRKVMGDLGDHILTEDGSEGFDPSAPERVGSADAFAAFIRKARRGLPVPATSLRI